MRMDRMKWILLTAGCLLAAGGAYAYLTLRRRDGRRLAPAPPRLGNPTYPIVDFDAATVWLSTFGDSLNLTDDQRLQCYGLFKQSTVGPCNVPQPGLIDLIARAKWTAWSTLGDMPKLEAQAQYLALIQSLQASLPTDGALPASSSSDNSARLGGPVLSRPIAETNDQEYVPQMHPLIEAVMKLDTTLETVKEEITKVTDSFQLNEIVDTTTGWTALHWAVDRGDRDIIAALLNAGASPNVVDQDGQSALDVAIESEDSDIIDLLHEHAISQH